MTGVRSWAKRLMSRRFEVNSTARPNLSDPVPRSTTLVSAHTSALVQDTALATRFTMDLVRIGALAAEADAQYQVPLVNAIPCSSIHSATAEADR